MSFNIIDSSKRIANKYRRYLKTMFDIKDNDYKRIFERRLEENDSFEKGPYLDVTNSFEKGRNIQQLIDANIISGDFKKIKRLYNIPNLHYHQEEALLKAIKGENLIVSTGTGSGKTECFLIPLINELMREKEQSKLTDGVRALIIYPMNALANDQIDRLRKTFIDYPDITFGCYTGQTPNHEKTMGKIKGAQDQYKELNEKRIDEPRLRTPLKNERLSRDSMKDRPPHILITNYAMLEYLMLRPDDNVFFDGKYANNWKYVILDEAHTYTGSTGIEVSMLLRRLAAKLNNKNLQFILTSATLGDEDSNKDVINFAESLCSTKFKEENIIRAKRIELKQIDSKYDLGTEFYSFVNELIDYGYDDKYIIEKIEEKYSFGLSNDSLSEYLYDLLICDNTFWRIKNFISKPKSIKDIRSYTNFSEKEVSEFVEVASRANKNNSKLFDSRYHMFLRATEGVFITLAPHKDLFLDRKNQVFVDDKEYKVFEVVTCTQCHSIYLLGYIKDNYLVQKSSAESDEIKEAFYLGSQVNDSDDDDSLENSELAVESFELCPHCGYIRSANEVHKSSCGHSESDFVKVIQVKSISKNDTARVTKCIACENVNRLGILRGFFTGQESSTSVIGTALFEELPSHIKKVTIHSENDYEDDGFDIDIPETVEEISKAKQFIAFSDSRQAAAYFSSYFSISYDSILYGRLIMEELKNCKKDDTDMCLFVENLAGRMKNNNIIPFDEYLHKLATNSHSEYDYSKTAWQAILKELVDCNQLTSLIGLGLLSLDFNPDIQFKPNNRYSLNIIEVKTICMVFVMGMLSAAAFYYPKSLNEADKLFFTHNGIEKSFLIEPSDSNPYINSFVPKKNTNKRMDYLDRILKVDNKDITEDQVKTVLKGIWGKFFITNIMYKTNNSNYKVNLENLVISKNRKWYRCNKCNKLTTFNVKGICPTFKCDGKLEDINIDKCYENNHYYRMYHDLVTEPLRVVEHTAQLSNTEAYKYQNLFKDQKIDVLSCSTTFEMGVDVGDLETVFMRNMPPSPSNYAQRAGRAGRSSTSAAYALTFCNKSNHDFNYFENPVNMINGIIMPPHFKVDNEKICIRHLYSSAFSYFFKNYPAYFNQAKDLMEICVETGLCGYDVLNDFLTNDSPQRIALKEFLKKSIPTSLHNKFELETFGWAKWLLTSHNEEYPSLKDVKDRYIKELTILREAYENAKAANEGIQYSYKSRIKNYEEEDIISFLSKNNILPKYGFPVDIVGLEINVYSRDKKTKGKNTKDTDLSGIELTRDLSMAISEYAPGCQVVANNQLITSRYIKKIPGFDWKKYDYIECDNCKTLNVEVQKFISLGDVNPLCTCKQCRTNLDEKNIKTFLIPEFGFISDENISKPSLIKPEKTYRTEASFFNYKDTTNETVYKIGDTNVCVSMVGNDGEMAMLNTTDFYVCPHCGYSIEKPDGLNPFARTFKDKNGHKDSKGYWCKKDVDLERYSLGYKFKTDVIKIKIEQPLMTTTSKHEEAYSILQAIILSACKELNIENTEIAGCLQYYFDTNGVNYAYILYDKTPGGAGHVKRLNNSDSILHVLINAMNLAQKCPHCDEDSSCYSCLRTYQNQKHHDIIKRNYVFNYLGQVLNGYTDGDADSVLEEVFLAKLQNESNSWKVTGTKKNIYIADFNGNKWTIEPQVYLDPMQNVISPSKPDFMLTPDNPNQKKIAIFTDGFKYHNDIIDKDSIKRDAIIYSENYRVWSLSWSDVKSATMKNVFATEIFAEKNLPNKLNANKYSLSYSNSFEILIEYLKDNNAEQNFKELADNYFNAMIGSNVLKTDIDLELVQLKDQLLSLKLDTVKNIDKYSLKDSQLSIYLINDDKHKVITYVQDYISKRKMNFPYDWNAYLQINNIMQFEDSFIQISQQGLDNEIYSILDNVVVKDENISAEWNEVLSQVFDNNAKQFIKDCISKNIMPPSNIGFELDDGSIAEIEWDALHIVYLTDEQQDYKDSFEQNGYDVVSSVEDFEKITSE